MKLYVLMENVASGPEFFAEHGLSIYIETGKHKILFDTGQSGAFADNAALLGVDLSKVDLAVLSHGHYDHGGGLKRFFERNDHAPVYMNNYAFAPYYHGTESFIGLDASLKASDRLIYTEDYKRIDDELELYTCNAHQRSYPTDSAGLTIKEDGVFVHDTFLHEQYLMIRDGARKILFSGCSHKGILNIMDWLQPDVFVGGFHFMNTEIQNGTSPVLDQAADVLNQYDTAYYTCHCTGQKQYDYLKSKMGVRLTYLMSGQVITI